VNLCEAAGGLPPAAPPAAAAAVAAVAAAAAAAAAVEMSGLLYFKLRSQLSFSTVTFDGHFVSVGEARRLIAAKMNLGTDAISELVLTDPRTGEFLTGKGERCPSSLLHSMVPQIVLSRKSTCSNSLPNGAGTPNNRRAA